MSTWRRHSYRALAAIVFVSACGGAALDRAENRTRTRSKAGAGKGDASAEAVFVTFDFDGELEVAGSVFNTQRWIEDQLLYSVGQLNGDNSIGRLDKVDLSNVQRTAIGGKTRIAYHASMLVAWGRRSDVPGQYTLTLPRDVSHGAQADFTAKYKDTCVDWSAHDVDSASMWYYYRPAASRCQLDAADVVSFAATVSPSSIQTTGKFPEYHKVYEDDTLKVVAVFGKYEDEATAASDAGIAAYNRFVRTTMQDLGGRNLQTVPASVPRSPGVAMPDIELHATLGNGRSVEIVALLVDNVRTAGATFDARYADLSRRADLIAYNGHAGLGANIRALARKGNWVTGQYAVVFMNGCDTYAYVDSALNDAHAAVNADDPKGTKYVDIVMNAMPAFFHEVADSTTTLIRGLIDYEAPKTFEQMFAGIDPRQVVLVSGEEDNTFVPGGGGGGEPWDGMSETGTVVRNQNVFFETPTLEAGRYAFELEGTGDADLYLRIGARPTTSRYDCRPYIEGSAETCVVDLPGPAPIHVMVRGWAATSDFTLVGRSQ